MRIKIYKPEGLAWANFEVPYYVGYKNILDDRIKFSNGTTYNLEIPEGYAVESLPKPISISTGENAGIFRSTSFRAEIKFS